MPTKIICDYPSQETSLFPFDSDDGNRSDRLKRLASSKRERTTKSIARLIILLTLTPTSLIAYDSATITRNHQPKILQLTTSSHSKLASIPTNAIALLKILLYFSENIKIEHTIKTQIEYL